LRDGSVAFEVDRRAAEEVQDAHAAREALAAHADELARGALEPRRHHAAVVVPHAGEALPVACVAPDDPVLDELADRDAVGGSIIHGERIQRR